MGVEKNVVLEMKFHTMTKALTIYGVDELKLAGERKAKSMLSPMLSPFSFPPLRFSEKVEAALFVPPTDPPAFY